jgi:hypothetical protein
MNRSEGPAEHLVSRHHLLQAAKEVVQIMPVQRFAQVFGVAPAS